MFAGLKNQVLTTVLQTPELEPCTDLVLNSQLHVSQSLTGYINQQQ